MNGGRLGRAALRCVPHVMRCRWTAGGNASGRVGAAQLSEARRATGKQSPSRTLFTVRDCERTRRIWPAGVQEV